MFAALDTSNTQHHVARSSDHNTQMRVRPSVFCYTKHVGRLENSMRPGIRPAMCLGKILLLNEPFFDLICFLTYVALLLYKTLTSYLFERQLDGVITSLLDRYGSRDRYLDYKFISLEHGCQCVSHSGRTSARFALMLSRGILQGSHVCKLDPATTTAGQTRTYFIKIRVLPLCLP